ncbi:hypothetical protein A2Z53_03055 [Candidatus Giovannonibacteria bacterium RIFCSPHIGHO2_02_42_15]|uniref:Glutaredoxin domain-containing protein n=2 Tax=Candidatus Giovannoniibacteriota TaxID=1752738 RepID=A0A1F5VPG3_9BACT|nr:MAG: hypothetical protein UV11_C0004G0013 [Candidatus Giovannonibacteria bacterium GW2011_GWF2_42_19]OGF64921.1 MAG: hypothetical protein A2Z53_03055 [Candidatus Giovannonibacteria bacterium RIFCSPHIGHO2_02_42_15]
MPQVTVYTTPSCPWCRAVKEFLGKHKIVYVEKDVSHDFAAREEMVSKSGELAVPVVDIGGEIVFGYNEQIMRTLLKIKF